MERSTEKFSYLHKNIKFDTYFKPFGMLQRTGNDLRNVLSSPCLPPAFSAVSWQLAL